MFKKWSTWPPEAPFRGLIPGVLSRWCFGQVGLGYALTQPLWGTLAAGPSGMTVPSKELQTLLYKDAVYAKRHPACF